MDPDEGSVLIPGMTHFTNFRHKLRTDRMVVERTDWTDSAAQVKSLDASRDRNGCRTGGAAGAIITDIGVIMSVCRAVRDLPTSLNPTNSGSGAEIRQICDVETLRRSVSIGSRKRELISASCQRPTPGPTRISASWPGTIVSVANLVNRRWLLKL